MLKKELSNSQTSSRKAPCGTGIVRDLWLSSIAQYSDTSKRELGTYLNNAH